ncbi:MAG TPA: LysM peptidoglycan-binding domain-containing protein [Ktedonobacteraceae bacterium]|nr:LysM peptidoglycan-binding domain-containing protein [Ktedonobacteraceae bacterium]
MQRFERIWLYVREHRWLSIALGHVCVLLALATLFFGSGLGSSMLGAFASSHCASGDGSYVTQRGDTLSGIAARYHTSWQSLATYNHIANPNRIYVGEMVCIPGQATVHQPVKGTGNYFPYGECTWWANQRYHQLHGIYVPWTTQSNALQWSARARQFYWHVSNKPSPGAILDLQPWVQGAYGLGHVAVVERILPNGHVIASSMNWGTNPDQVTDMEFVPGNGVSFISF